MPDSFSVAILLVLAGLLATLFGLLGALLWVDGKPRAQIRSKSARVLVFLIGVGLMFGGIWHERTLVQVAQDTAQKPGATSIRLDILEQELNLLRARVALTAQHTESVSNDNRTIAFRVGKAARGEDSHDCFEREYRRLRTEWGPGQTNPCSRLLNALWALNIVVSLPQSGDNLKKSLEELGFPVNLANKMPDVPSLAEPGLGMVFPEDAPRRLVCEARIRFLEVTRQDLIVATTTSHFRRASHASTSDYAIQLGVAFQTFFESYPKIDSRTWDRLCGPDQTAESFANFFSNREGEFEARKLTDTEARASSNLEP